MRYRALLVHLVKTDACVWLFGLKMLRRGKHRGRRFEDVAAIDRGYCAWVLREKALPLHSFYRYLIKAHGGILNVGKHKGRYSTRC